MLARRFLALSFLLAVAMGAAPASEPEGRPALSWLAADGKPLWAARLDAAPTGAPTVPLSTVPAFRPLPAFAVKLLDGGQLESKSLAGSVVLLDFWASWCAPCLQELPHLQKLYDKEHERGLAAVAVNADEPRDVVEKTAARLGLTMPVGLYEDALRETFGVRTLPTLVLADRQGRIRARWDGYTAGLERTIAELVRELLGEDREGRSRELAKVLEGAGIFEVAWAIEMRAPVSGLAVLGSARADSIGAVVAAGDQLALLSAAGVSERRLKLPSSAWRLAAPPAQPDRAAPDVLAFRAGAGEVLSIDIDQGMMRGWSAPGPVFGMTFAARGAGEDARVWLATLEGVGMADLAGRAVERAGESGEFLSAASGPAGGLLALSRDGAIRRFDVGGVEGRRTISPEGTRQIVTAPGRAGAGVMPPTVAAFAVGAFFGGVSRQAAIATLDGDLAVLDLETGRLLFRAAWPSIVALSAGDLDGDGRDELLVGAGRTVAALRTRLPEAAKGP